MGCVGICRHGSDRAECLCHNVCQGWALSPQEQVWQGGLPFFLCSSACFWSFSADLQQKPLTILGNNLINRVVPSGDVCLVPLWHSKSHSCFYGMCCSDQQPPLRRRILHLHVLYRSQDLDCPTRNCLLLSLVHRRVKLNPNQLYL